MTIKRELKALQDELDLLKKEYNKKIGEIHHFSNKIESLQLRINRIESNSFEKIEEEKEEVPLHKPLAPEPVQLKRELFRDFGKGLSAAFAAILASPFLGPFFNVIERLTGLFKKYRAQGKLPILFLTFTGIVALVFGFGYLFQHTFINYFNEVAKVASGFLGAVGFIIIGMKIISHNREYKEYGSALIGLGIILIYLCIFFSTNYYNFFPILLGFLLVVVNTFFAYMMALKYETRIVSLITFLGGSFTPFFLAMTNQLEVFYCFLLLLVCIMSIHLSKKIPWSLLLYISFLTAGSP